MTTKKTFTIGEVNRVVKFLAALEAASREHRVRIDSMDGIYVRVDGKDTAFFLDAEDDAYGLSVVVSL